MQSKIDKVKKMLAFLESKRLNLPYHASPEAVASLRRQMKEPTKLDGVRDVELIFEPGRPLLVSVRTSLESGHNGSSFDHHNEDVPITDEFVDAAVMVLKTWVRDKVCEDLRRDDRERFARRVDARIHELRLDE